MFIKKILFFNCEELEETAEVANYYKEWGAIWGGSRGLIIGIGIGLLLSVIL